MASLYSNVLGPAWEDLPKAVRRSLTSPLLASGRLDVHAPSSRAARAIARLIKLPPPGPDVECSVELRSADEGVEWIRIFGRMRAVSVQKLVLGAILERAGPYELELLPRVDGQALLISSGRLRLFHVPAPRSLGPSIAARLAEGPDEFSWLVSVRISHPWFGTICEYEGVMRSE